MISDPLNIKTAPVVATNNDIVFLGCSYTYGSCLPSTATRYSTILSQHYNKTEINLSKGGTGNYRTFDIFGQIEFNPGSMLVLQIAELSRIRWYDNRIVDQQLFPQVQLASAELLYLRNKVALTSLEQQIKTHGN